jgi:transcriptional regulator with XRE-family HTH domain
MSPGQLLKDARGRHRVSQRELAIRAGTTQSAISRIERDRVSPSIETLAQLLYLLGERLALKSEVRDTGVDPTLIQGALRRSPGERLDYGIAFANQVIQLSPNPKRSGWSR